MKSLAHCRKPRSDEKKDANWHCIQKIIENKYSISESLKGINECATFLKSADAAIAYQNFGSLNEADIEEALGFVEFTDDVQLEKLQKKLQLKSFLLAICNKGDIKLVESLFSEYYQKGLCYYISWGIMLLTLANIKNVEFNHSVINVFVDIEINNFYGIGSVEAALKQYWLGRR